MNEKSKRGREERCDILKMLTWDYCGKHKQNYPKGAKCPKCEVEQQKQKKR